MSHIHNKYVNFKVKVTAGPFRGDHFGYIPEVKIYKGSILENTNVKFILNTNNNHVSIENFASYFFGPKAELQKQVWEAITSYDPKLIMSPKTIKTFGELIDEL